MAIDFDSVRSQVSLTEIAARYVELKRKGSELLGRCPFHEERTPSFSVFSATDGHERFYCFGCGTGGDVIDFTREIMNVDTSEAVGILTNGRLPAVGEAKIPKPAPDESETWVPIIPVPDDAPKYDPAKTYNPKRGRTVCYRPERMDPYFDANEKLVCWVVRLVFDDGVKLCPTITYCEGPDGTRCWAAKRMDPPYPLMGADELATRPEDAVLLVSGEKCKSACSNTAPGFITVTWLGGDQCAGKADIEPLKGRFITFWPDADESGVEAMRTIAKRLGYL